jgi:uncharacterized membrane-anchored protein
VPHPALPDNHPDRILLDNEVHARPPESIPANASASFLALTGDRSDAPLRALCRMFGAPEPAEGSNHFSGALGPLRVKWERHTEFVRYKFIVPRPARAELFAKPAIASVPAEWLKTLQGKIIAACHVELVSAKNARIDEEKLSRGYFAGKVIVGASIASGAGMAVTDFRIHDDGFGRFIVYDLSMTERQRGRSVQRLVEIDAYKMLALLTLPVARDLMPKISGFEAQLDEVTREMRTADKAKEPDLLDRLTRLNSDIVHAQTESRFRFSAGEAYDGLVKLRTSELREARLAGLQTFSEFIARRLDPAMRTCASVAGRLTAISEHVAQATQLLQTRVDITRQSQNQALLESMDRRAQLQLRLQETVEGLSIAAITYYIVGLIGYAADGAKDLGLLPVSKHTVVLASIPLVLAAVWLGMRRLRKSLRN